MFRGIAEISLDPKGRLAIPAKYREVLAELCRGQLVATIDITDTCLRLYPLPVWQEIEAQLEALPSTDQNARRVQRLLLGHASDLEMDGNGRVLLPSTLRKFAGLDKKLVLVGLVNKFELWSEENWQRCHEASKGDFELPAALASIAL
jgi:MraZ protein